MTAPVFNQASGRLYALSSSGDAGVPGYWGGYLCSPAAAFGARASLPQAWADGGGVFLFLGAAPADAGAFADALIGLLPQLSPRGWVRWLWIANPNDPAPYWQAQQLDAAPVADAAAAWRVMRDAHFSLGPYAVGIDGGAMLGLDTTAGQESIGIGAGALRLVAPDGVYAAQGALGRLPFAGGRVGAFVFDIALANGATSTDDMARLAVMWRYSLEDPESPVGATRLVDMPLLRQADATVIPMRVAYDPLHPLARARSGLDFFPAPGAAPPALDCALLTNRGEATLLRPFDGAWPLSPARLVFGRSPLFDAADPAGAVFDYHLTPDGAFTLTVAAATAGAGGTVPAQAKRLMLGACGTEYALLPEAGNCLAYFRGGGAAHVPAAPDPAGAAERALLSNLGTTGYATILPGAAGDGGLDYYAQPLQAPLYDVEGAIGADFLEFHEMRAASLPAYSPADSAPPVVMPLAAFSRIASGSARQARLIEEAALAPRRRSLVGLSGAAHQQVTTDSPLAVTPQGLVAMLSGDAQSWAGVLLANMPQSMHRQLALTAVGPAMQSALQSNQLFFVVSNVDTFMAQSSVSYQLTAENALSLMHSTGVPGDVAAAVKEALAAHAPPFPLCLGESGFDQVVAAAARTWLPQVRAAAGLLRADIEGWNFQLSPRGWRKGDAPTLMIFKFCNRALTELAADPASWAWQDAARDGKGSLAPTQNVLGDIIEAARRRADASGVHDDDPYLRFYLDVASNPLWNGVLFLNAPVDFTQMPAALQFMSAGIDTTRFFAHHIGFSVTPYAVGQGSIELGRTAAFGLIDYQDPDDLVASVPPQDFGFKTLQLRVLFANAAIRDFSARVELMLNRLFGSPVQKQDPSRGNNLVLDGSYQRVGGIPAYSFALRGKNLYVTQHALLLNVEVLGTRLETSSASAGANRLTARFVLSGKMRFGQIDAFDLFSFGPEPGRDGFVSFDGLPVGMSFDLDRPEKQEFAIAEGALSFDTSPTGSVARAASLANNFPLQLLQLVASPNQAPAGQPPQGQSPADFGFASIAAPFEQSPLASPWYGLTFNLDFGTLGALAGALGMKGTLLAAWAQGMPQAETPPAFLGLKLSTSSAIDASLPLQGVLKLGCRSFGFETYPGPDQQPAYLLRMRRFALSVLAWSFPPGNTDLMLFGAPGQPQSSLGWYAAYGADPGDKASGRAAQALAPARHLKSGRRTPPVGS